MDKLTESDGVLVQGCHSVDQPSGHALHGICFRDLFQSKYDSIKIALNGCDTFRNNPMNKPNLSHKEKQLALSSLLRRDRSDPGAAQLVTQMMRDDDFAIRKRAVSIADRFLQHCCTHKTLLRIATESSEHAVIRERSLDQLDDLFDPNTPSASITHCEDSVRYRMKRKLIELVRNPADRVEIRGHALRICAYVLTSDALHEWILFFHNRTRTSCRLSAISAMGRSGDNRWRNYLHGFLETDDMEYTCAALEAIAELDYRPEDMIATEKKNETPADHVQEAPGLRD